MTNCNKALFSAVIVAVAGFTYSMRSHRNVPTDLRDAVADRNSTEFSTAPCPSIEKDKGNIPAPNTPKDAHICQAYRQPMSTAEAVKRLATIGNFDLRRLFYCDLPKMGGKIQPADYPDLLKTEPYRFDWSRYVSEGILTVDMEYWDVRWAYGFDSRKAYMKYFADTASGELSSNPDFLESMLFIRKEFPEKRGATLLGWSSFGYSRNAASANPTLNTVKPQLLADGNAKDMPVMMMNYAEKPWYFDSIGEGVLDYFRFLSKDIVIAQGVQAFYDRNDAKIPGSFKLTPPWQQFWMERKREAHLLDFAKGTSFLSIPMLKWIWDHSTVPASTADLTGTWDADLMMNGVIIRAQSRFVFGSSGKGRLDSNFGGKQESYEALSAPIGSGDNALTLELSSGDAPLTLKQASPGIPVFIGRRCIDKERIPEKWVEFLPARTRRIFMAQYFISDNAGNQSYCLHYLLRKSAASEHAAEPH